MGEYIIKGKVGVRLSNAGPLFAARSFLIPIGDCHVARTATWFSAYHLGEVSNGDVTVCLRG
jgi:hypothetical protein